MPLYDDNTNLEKQSQNEVQEVLIELQDGGFFPFLKYFIYKATSIPLEYIMLRDYNQENIFLSQDTTKKIYCEMIDFDTITMTGRIYENGDVDIVNSVKYRIYCINDTYKIPMLIEYAFKTNQDNLHTIAKECNDTELGEIIYNNYLDVPSMITISSKKRHYQGATYPIVALDVTMIGRLRNNIDYLKDEIFNDITNNINFNIRSK